MKNILHYSIALAIFFSPMIIPIVVYFTIPGDTWRLTLILGLLMVVAFGVALQMKTNTTTR